MNIALLTFESLLNGIIIGLTMLTEILKQNPWFIGIVIIAILAKPKKHKRLR